jgi:hypothetical protein
MASSRSHGYTAGMKILISALTLALFGMCSTAMAQWQWLDKDGRKVFSDRAPPSDVAEKSILKRPNMPAKAPVVPATSAAAPTPDDGSSVATAPAPMASRPLGSGVDKELEARKKQAADAEAAKRKLEQEQVTKTKIENCARAKQAKASFDSGTRLSRTNAAGEREILDDAARAAELKRMQAIMDSQCR